MKLNIRIYDLENKHHIIDLRKSYYDNVDLYILYNIDKCLDKDVIEHLYRYEIDNIHFGSSVLGIVKMKKRVVISDLFLNVIDKSNICLEAEINGCSISIINTTGSYPVVQESERITIVKIDDPIDLDPGESNSVCIFAWNYDNKRIELVNATHCKLEITK